MAVQLSVRHELRKSIFLFLLIVTCFLDSYAQSFPLVFKHLTREHGLPSNSISSTIQDDDGFMWFGTTEGLSRFDGYTFINFDITNAPVRHSMVTCLEKEEGERLIVGTSHGLFAFNLSTYRRSEEHTYT